jgi:hypothetical protein
MRFNFKSFKHKSNILVFRRFIFIFIALCVIYCIYNNLKNDYFKGKLKPLKIKYTKCININHYLRYECLEKFCGGWGMYSNFNNLESNLLFV